MKITLSSQNQFKMNCINKMHNEREKLRRSVKHYQINQAAEMGVFK